MVTEGSPPVRRNRTTAWGGKETTCYMAAARSEI